MHTHSITKAIINLEIQSELVELIGIEEMRELVREASLEFQEIALPLKDVLRDGDWQNVRSLSHKLKGLIGSLGYERLYSDLNDLEKQLLNQPPCLPEEAQIAQLLQDMEDAQQAMKIFLN